MTIPFRITGVNKTWVKDAFGRNFSRPQSVGTKSPTESEPSLQISLTNLLLCNLSNVHVIT